LRQNPDDGLAEPMFRDFET
jgi:hypothetical protein